MTTSSPITLELHDIQAGALFPRPSPYAGAYILLRIDDRRAPHDRNALVNGYKRIDGYERNGATASDWRSHGNQAANCPSRSFGSLRMTKAPILPTAPRLAISSYYEDNEWLISKSAMPDMTSETRSMT